MCDQPNNPVWNDQSLVTISLERELAECILNMAQQQMRQLEPQLHDQAAHMRNCEYQAQVTDLPERVAQAWWSESVDAEQRLRHMQHTYDQLTYVTEIVGAALNLQPDLDTINDHVIL